LLSLVAHAGQCLGYVVPCRAHSCQRHCV
jgi:hypothetical protein